MMAFQWCPISRALLESSENTLLRGVTTPCRILYVNIGKCVGETDNLIRTLILNESGPNTPLVLVHEFGLAVGSWVLNLDSLARDRPVFAFDVLGFGSSSRPNFSSNALEAEAQMVKSFEEWAKTVGLKKFVLLGHGMGAFLVSAYALQHPDRVLHLVLADPVGFPDPSGLGFPLLCKTTEILLRRANPLFLLRASGPLGPRLVKHYCRYLTQKFAGKVENADETISQYLYQCNAQNPTGETCFHAMMANLECAKHPMVNRLPALEPEIPITFIYGASSWVVREPGLIIKERRNGSTVNLNVIGGAGHHVYADKVNIFNEIVLEACMLNRESAAAFN